MANVPYQWDALLPFVCFQYNTTPWDSFRVSPYTGVHGANPRIISLPEPTLTKLRTMLLALEHCIAGFPLARTIVTNFLEAARKKTATLLQSEKIRC